MFKSTITYRFLTTGLFVSLFSAQLCGQLSNEDAVKAALIDKFIKFIEWPDTSSSSFNIYFLGDNPIGKNLEILYKNKKINNMAVHIRYANKLEEVDDANILFVSGNKKSSIDEIKEKFASKPVLTIGDSPGFAERGVMINFYQQNNTIGFSINENSIKKSGLYVSYRLLRVANIVEYNNK